MTGRLLLWRGSHLLTAAALTAAWLQGHKAGVSEAVFGNSRERSWSLYRWLVWACQGLVVLVQFEDSS